MPNFIDNDDDLDLDAEQDKEALAIAKRANDNDRAVARMLRNLLKKSFESLTLDDKKFIKARASYLTKSEREDYADIINADYSDGVGATPEAGPAKLEDETRDTLEQKARDLMIPDVEKFPNKKTLIEAIVKAQAQNQE